MDENKEARPPQERDFPTLSLPGTGSIETRPAKTPDIEGYSVTEMIGAGGMGTVWLAEELATHREVAVKFINPSFIGSKNAAMRFEREVLLAASMDHPNIAKVYSAGRTKAGDLFLVMEYVKGTPITTYCDEKRHSIEDRLRMFLDVCEAIQHAHHKSIVHRDIKPSNILVSAEGEDFVPKVIDFGLAKGVGQQFKLEPAVTEQWQLLGTPEYMSPEQIDMANGDVDTRSDIYSLGVLLYELMTGSLPFSRATLTKAGMAEILRIAQEEAPPRPSERLSDRGGMADKVAQCRRTKAAALVRRLHDELEWIPLKAMRKDRAERYRTPSELADDIRNYLRGNPLTAGPETVAYKFKKLARKHVGAIVGVAVLLCVLIIGLVVGTALYVRGDRARIESGRVAGLLGDILQSVEPSARGEPASVRELLDEVSDRINSGLLANQPGLEADVRRKLAIKDINSGHHDRALPRLRAALPIRQQTLGEGHEKTLETASRLVRALTEGAEYREAETLARQTLARAIQSLGPDHQTTLYAQGRMASLLNYMGRYDEAIIVNRQVVAAQIRLHGENNIDTLWAMHGLASSYRNRYEHGEAEKWYRRVWQIRRRLLGEGHQETLYAMRCVAWILKQQGELHEAEEIARPMLDLAKKSLGERHVKTMDCTYVYAAILMDKGDYAGAEPLFRNVLDEVRTRLGQDDIKVAYYTLELGKTIRGQGRYDEALALLQWSAKRIQVLEYANDNMIGMVMGEVGECLQKMGRHEEAEEQLLQGFQLREDKIRLDIPRTQRAVRRLVELYDDWNKPDEAARWRAKLLDVGRDQE